MQNIKDLEMEVLKSTKSIPKMKKIIPKIKEIEEKKRKVKEIDEKIKMIDEIIIRKIKEDKPIIDKKIKRKRKNYNISIIIKKLYII